MVPVRPWRQATAFRIRVQPRPAPIAGEKIAADLVERKLAACVNIVPGLTSVYWWDGKVNKDPEEMLIIKTRPALMEALTAQVKKLHPYDECEIIGLPVVAGSPSYLQWVLDSTAKPSLS